MSDLLSLSAVEARTALDAGDVSAPELTEAYIGAIEETGALNNYVAVTADKAMDMANASQVRIRAGEAGFVPPASDFHESAIPRSEEASDAVDTEYV